MKKLTIPVKFLNALVILVMMITSISAKAQQISVTGVVTDSNQQTLPGVNIVEEGTENGTVTDQDGSYSLDVSSKDAILTFSYIGYLSEDIPVDGRNRIDVELIPDITKLDEFVVVGYGTMRRSDVTGAVVSVNTEELQKAAPLRIEDALRGRAAGVLVSKTSSRPGAGSTIHIRGIGSLGNTEPLWVVDGVPMDPGTQINMQDVESVEILKDAASAAIYGSRAAHGVILVTTKRGESGAPRISYRTQLGVNDPTYMPDMLNTSQFLEMNIDARINAGINYEEYEQDPNMLPDTDWKSLIWDGSGFVQNHLLSVTGGTNDLNYYFSLGYDNEEGVLIDNSIERFSLRLNTEYDVFDFLKIGETLSLTRSNENPITEHAGNIGRLIRAIPVMPLYDENNPFGGWGRAPEYANADNPVAKELQLHSENITSKLAGSLFAEAQILDGLSVRATFGTEISSFRNRSFQEAFNYGRNNDPRANLGYVTDQFESYLGSIVATYQKSFNDHEVTAMAGYEARETKGVAFGSSISEFPVTFAESQAMATGDFNILRRDNVRQSAYVSQFGRIIYNFDNKYLFQGNIRRDGSYIFAPENRWGIFPSLSLGWRISEEDFMDQFADLSNLRLRGGWGVNGSDNIPAYLFSRTYTTDRSNYTFSRDQERQTGFYLRRFPNAEAKWESIEQINIGLDIGFFNDRITFSADYYEKETQDMFFGVTIPPSFGVSTDRFPAARPQVNVGNLKNTGVEFTLAYSQQLGELKLNLEGNISSFRNEVTKLFTEDDVLATTGTFLFGSVGRVEVGEPIGFFYGYESEGIFNSQEEVDAANAGSESGTYWQENTAPGDLRFKDQDGDGRITPDDRVKIGNPWPDFMYGFNINGEYRNFDFTIFLQGVYGNDIYSEMKGFYRHFYSTSYNTTPLIYDSWTEQNPSEHPRNITGDPSSNFSTPSSYFIEDGSYLKLRNLQIGYTLPVNINSAIGIRSFRIFVSGENLLTFSRYPFEPELAGGNLSRGVDGINQYPQARLISAGVNINL